MMISQEMIYAGGNNWVLERLEEIDGERIYFRMSDTMFVRSRRSFEEVQNDADSIDEYWEAGACNWEASPDTDDIRHSIGWIVFEEMVEVWQHDPKKLVAAEPNKLSDYNQKEIVATYVPERDITIIMIEIYSADGEPISTELVGWYYGQETTENTFKYIGKLKAEYTL